MFDESIARVAAAFLEIDGVLYAPAGALMELFAAYSAVIMGVALVILLSIFAFMLLVVEPVGDAAAWALRKAISFFRK